MQWVGGLGAACGGGGWAFPPAPRQREGHAVGGHDAAGDARAPSALALPRMKINVCPLRVALCCTRFRPLESFVSEG